MLVLHFLCHISPFCCEFFREKSLLDEKAKAREDLAKQREETAHRLEVEYENRIRDEVEKYDNFIYVYKSESCVCMHVCVSVAVFLMHSHSFQQT